MRHTALGLEMRAVGGNAAAARFAGISVPGTLLMTGILLRRARRPCRGKRSRGAEGLSDQRPVARLRLCRHRRRHAGPAQRAGRGAGGHLHRGRLCRRRQHEPHPCHLELFRRSGRRPRPDVHAGGFALPALSADICRGCRDGGARHHRTGKFLGRSHPDRHAAHLRRARRIDLRACRRSESGDRGHFRRRRHDRLADRPSRRQACGWELPSRPRSARRWGCCMACSPSCWACPSM